MIGSSWLINDAQVSPERASVEEILKADLYGTAILLEEVGKVIKPGGAGITIPPKAVGVCLCLRQNGTSFQITAPAEELLKLEMLQPRNITDNLHAYQMAKCCNKKRVMAEAVKLGERGAWLNDIASEDRYNKKVEIFLKKGIDIL
ncbi:MAG: hypothetical protein K2N36_09285 [Ruminiclostridium sp.]|nr:hypothetical protein [Ruminiclostridium sp.]